MDDLSFVLFEVGVLVVVVVVVVEVKGRMLLLVDGENASVI